MGEFLLVVGVFAAFVGYDLCRQRRESTKRSPDAASSRSNQPRQGDGSKR
ncbi:MAG: hypothetical protein K2P79_13695 [Sphingomonas sp.]|jgi:hypothetical protein|nr:hypothetical protein [Sphingomonas sp.]